MKQEFRALDNALKQAEFDWEFAAETYLPPMRCFSFKPFSPDELDLYDRSDPWDSMFLDKKMSDYTENMKDEDWQQFIKNSKENRMYSTFSNAKRYYNPAKIYAQQYKMITSFDSKNHIQFIEDGGAFQPFFQASEWNANSIYSKMRRLYFLSSFLN